MDESTESLVILIGTVIAIVGTGIWIAYVVRTTRYTWVINQRWGRGAATLWFNGKLCLTIAGLMAVIQPIVFRWLGPEFPQIYRWIGTMLIIVLLIRGEQLVGNGFKLVSDREAEELKREQTSDTHFTEQMEE